MLPFLFFSAIVLLIFIFSFSIQMGFLEGGQVYMMFCWVLNENNIWNSLKYDFIVCYNMKVKVKVKSLSRVWLLATPRTAPYQAPVSMGFSRQEYWSGLPLPFILILLVLLFYFSSLSRRFFQLYQLTSLLYFFCYHITWIFLFHGFSFMHSFSLRRYLVFKKVS